MPQQAKDRRLPKSDDPISQLFQGHGSASAIQLLLTLLAEQPEVLSNTTKFFSDEPFTPRLAEDQTLLELARLREDLRSEMESKAGFSPARNLSDSEGTRRFQETRLFDGLKTLGNQKVLTGESDDFLETIEILLNAVTREANGK